MAERLGSGTTPTGPAGLVEDSTRGAPSVQGSAGSRGSLLAPRSAKQVRQTCALQRFYKERHGFLLQGWQLMIEGHRAYLGKQYAALYGKDMTMQRI